MTLNFVADQWDEQAKVSRARQALETHGVRTWMDISGGMGTDVYHLHMSGSRPEV
jgi:DNA primase